ncbi:hypothetical protein FACS189499_03690 [Clostridia bacterium]|nr:hypothetical protein FACS189499_03690 [Clostridia bacterium]
MITKLMAVKLHHYSEERMAIITPNYDHIPPELKQLPQWVCAQNDSKAPMRATERIPASSTSSNTWTDFGTALHSVTKGRYDYCGFVFADNGIVGIDIDVGYDEDGLMSQLAADIIGACESYTEKSKSGRGFHILLKGELPFKGKNNLAGVEIYKSARYFIMTGNTLLFSEMRENQEAIDYVCEKYFSNTRNEKECTNFGMRIYAPIWELPKENCIKLRPVYPRVTTGSRNLCLTSLAGTLHNLGYGKQEIYKELCHANATACDPALADSELQTITNSVTRYVRSRI